MNMIGYEYGLDRTISRLPSFSFINNLRALHPTPKPKYIRKFMQLEDRWWIVGCMVLEIFSLLAIFSQSSALETVLSFADVFHHAERTLRILARRGSIGFGNYSKSISLVFSNCLNQFIEDWTFWFDQF